MFKLIVRIDQFTHIGGHIKIRIIDLDSEKQEALTVSFASKQGPIVNNNYWNKEEEECQVCPEGDFGTKTTLCGPLRQELYSNVNTTLAQFSDAIKAKFVPEAFEICENNCSDVGHYVLDYFFPNSRLSKILLYPYRCITAPLCLASYGMVGFFGAPPGINTAPDVMKRVFLLAHYYGNAPEKIKNRVFEDEKEELMRLTAPSPMRMV